MLNRPQLLLGIAIGMMVLGVVFPFLMVIHILESTFFLNFLSFILSTLGMFLGVVGIAVSRTRGRRKDDDDRLR